MIYLLMYIIFCSEKQNTENLNLKTENPKYNIVNFIHDEIKRDFKCFLKFRGGISFIGNDQNVDQQKKNDENPRNLKFNRQNFNLQFTNRGSEKDIEFNLEFENVGIQQKGNESEFVYDFNPIFNVMIKLKKNLFLIFCSLRAIPSSPQEFRKLDQVTPDNLMRNYWNEFGLQTFPVVGISYTTKLLILFFYFTYVLQEKECVDKSKFSGAIFNIGGFKTIKKSILGARFILEEKKQIKCIASYFLSGFLLINISYFNKFIEKKSYSYLGSIILSLFDFINYFAKKQFLKEINSISNIYIYIQKYNSYQNEKNTIKPHHKAWIFGVSFFINIFIIQILYQSNNGFIIIIKVDYRMEMKKSFFVNERKITKEITL